jgi:hypothetical protein
MESILKRKDIYKGGADIITEILECNKVWLVYENPDNKNYFVVIYE